MNVFVYSGPEVLQPSLKYALSTLRSILIPNYTIQTISKESLILQPWSPGCALLVFPGCYELSYLAIIPPIRQYVENGGAFLALSAGANYSSSQALHLDSLTIFSLPNQILRFHDKATASYLYPKFLPIGEAITSSVQLATGERAENIQQTWPGEFSGFENAKNVKVLAYNGEKVAALQCNLSKGTAVIWAPGIELPITADSVNLGVVEVERQKLMRSTLQELGLHIPPEAAGTILYPLPQFLVAPPTKPYIVSQIVDALSESSPVLKTFKDSNDTFHFHSISESEAVLQEADSLPKSHSQLDPCALQPKHIIVYRDGELPSAQQTPLFNLGSYFNELSTARANSKHSGDPSPWAMGEALIYGKVITSTQTMLEKNSRFMSLLPTPILSLASIQLAGRGRGTNTWLSPSGCLQFSLLLRTSLVTLPASKLVFVQYLFGLAVAEACREDTVLGKLGEKIRLKWPNDLYAVIGTGDGDRKKIGGILINTSFTGNQVDIVIGCGLNVLNQPPIISLAQLPPQNVEHNLSMERTIAAIMSKFEIMWSTFISHHGSFDSFMGLYLERWLHSDQLVTLTTTTPHRAVRITGITPDHGLLRTVPEKTSEQEFINLQPDGNSFDIMAGLIHLKK